jgi:hypothetical protein
VLHDVYIFLVLTLKHPISDTPPARWDELIHSAIDAKSPFTLNFEHDQRGKTVYEFRRQNSIARKIEIRVKGEGSVSPCALHLLPFTPFT